MKNVREWLWNEAHRCATEWFHAQCRSPFGRFCLYYKRGSLRLIEGDPPDGWTLGWQERVAPNQTIEQLTAWIVERAQRLPCLPEGDE